MLARIRKDNGARKRRADAIDIAVGEHIRLRRIEVRISQDQLAGGCGVTFQQIQKYENGTDRVSISRFVKIADVLGIAPDRLLAECISEQRRAA